MTRFRILLIVLAVILVTWAWVFFGGVDMTALRAVQKHIDPAIDPDRTLGVVFDTYEHGQAEWTPMWSNDKRYAAVTLRFSSIAEFDAACPGLLDPLRHLMSMDPRWAGFADDLPLAIQMVFSVTNGEGERMVEPAQVLVTEAWAVMKPEHVDTYTENIEKSIANSNDRSLAKRYRLRLDGDRALFNLGLNPTALAIKGMAPPTEAIHRIVTWH
jgi:hypothetical protein